MIIVKSLNIFLTLPKYDMIIVKFLNNFFRNKNSHPMIESFSMLFHSYDMFIPILVCHVWKQFTSWFNKHALNSSILFSSFIHTRSLVHQALHQMVRSIPISAAWLTCNCTIECLSLKCLHSQHWWFLSRQIWTPSPFPSNKIFFSWIYVNYNNCWLIVAIFL